MQEVIEVLKKISVPCLANKLGNNNAKIIETLGYAINSESLAEALFLNKGINIFKDMSFRRQALGFFLRQDPDQEDIKNISSFAWNNNKKAKLFFETLKIPFDNIDFDNRGKDIVTNVISPELPLFDYQKWIKFKIHKFLHNKNLSRTIVHMPTGSGKTRVAIESLVDYLRTSEPKNKTIVWMAHSEELCEQAYETFENIWNRFGLGPLNIIRLWGGNTLEKINTDKISFIITSFQTTYNLIKTGHDKKSALFNKIRRSTDILVVDEAHQSIAETYSTAIELISNSKTKIIGLTATPGRSSDIETGELVKFYQGSIISITDNEGEELGNRAIPYLQEQNILSKVEHLTWDGIDLNLSNEDINSLVSKRLDVSEAVLRKLGQNSKRNISIVINILELALNKNLQTIVFAPSKQSAIDIALMLKLKNCSAVSITGESGSKERINAINNFKNKKIKVITNYGVLTTGFDAPNTEAVVVARPTSSVVLYSQMIGRGIRGLKMGGTLNCIIVDVKDNIVRLPDTSSAFIYYNKFFD